MKKTVFISALFLALTCVWYMGSGQLYAATVITTASSDTLNTFRTNVNTSLTNLNAGFSNASSTEPSMAKYYVATSTLIASQFPLASTTALSATTLCFIGDTCRTTWPSGSGGSSAWPFTPSNYNSIANQSTTTPLWLKNTTIIASSTLFSTATTTGNAFFATNTGGVGIATTTTTNNALQNNIFTIAGTSTIWAKELHLGDLVCSSNNSDGNAGTVFEICGDYNSDLQAVQLNIQNNNAGNNAWGGLSLNNDLAVVDSNANPNYGGLFLQSSTYNSAFFSDTQGKNSLSLVNSMGEIDIASASSSNALSPQGIRFFTRGQNAANEVGQFSFFGNFLVGTTTGTIAQSIFASSTAPQLALSDKNSASNLWTFRNTGNTLYIATSTATATSTKSALTIDPNGIVTTNTASTSLLYLATGNCSGSSALTVTSGLVGCGAIAGGAASTTLLTDNNTFSGTNKFASPLAINTSAAAATWPVTVARMMIAGTSNNIVIASSTDSGTASNSSFYTITDASQTVLRSNGANVSGTLFGQNKAGWGQITAQNGTGGTNNGLMIGTIGAAPLLFGTNNTSILTILSAGNVGVSTTTPTATLTVQLASSTLATGNAFDVWGLMNTVIWLFERIDLWGHLITSGPAPVLSSCGTSTISGNDRNGTITLIGVALTSCTATFAHAYAAAPDCMVSDNTTASAADVDCTASTMTVGLSVGLNSGKVFYQVVQHQ